MVVKKRLKALMQELEKLDNNLVYKESDYKLIDDLKDYEAVLLWNRIIKNVDTEKLVQDIPNICPICAMYLSCEKCAYSGKETICEKFDPDQDRRMCFETKGILNLLTDLQLRF
jgi:hypothetical protein